MIEFIRFDVRITRARPWSMENKERHRPPLQGKPTTQHQVEAISL
jgi:hypothetical protein